MKKCTLALGCFWKPEENFKNKPGIIETEVGYAGGLSDKVTYEEVCKGDTGHAEVVRLTFDENKNYEYIKSEMPPIGIVKYFTESMVKSNTINLKDKTFVVYTDGVTEGYMKNGEELGAEGVQKIINEMSQVTPKSIVEAIEKELNWGAEKLRDDITCMAININNTELIKKK